MIDELNGALKTYHTKWHELTAKRKNKAFFERLKPIAVAWKVEDLSDFDQRFASLRDTCDQIHLGWLDGRWLATLHLKESALLENISVIKIMQRRPGSTDAVGLDHVDFLLPDDVDALAILKSEPDLKWTEELGGTFCTWVSLWFAGTEAKLRAKNLTTPDACIRELEEMRAAVMKEVS
jgi:hypothetical protein